MAAFSLGVIVVVVAVAALLQLEVEYEPLIIEKSVVLQGSDVEVFKFVADLPNYDKVSTKFKLIITRNDS